MNLKKGSTGSFNNYTLCSGCVEDCSLLGIQDTCHYSDGVIHADI